MELVADSDSLQGMEEQAKKVPYVLETAGSIRLVYWLDNSELVLGHCFQAGNGLWLNYLVDSKAVAEVVSHSDAELLGQADL